MCSANEHLKCPCIAKLTIHVQSDKWSSQRLCTSLESMTSWCDKRRCIMMLYLCTEKGHHFIKSSGGFKGAPWRAPVPPTAQNFLDFMQFSGKFGKIICWRPPRVGAPSHRESWIRPWREPLNLSNFLSEIQFARSKTKLRKTRMATDSNDNGWDGPVQVGYLKVSEWYTSPLSIYLQDFMGDKMNDRWSCLSTKVVQLFSLFVHTKNWRNLQYLRIWIRETLFSSVFAFYKFFTTALPFL